MIILRATELQERINKYNKCPPELKESVQDVFLEQR